MVQIFLCSLRFFYIHIQQMYRLYKDPTGEIIYSDKAGDTSIEFGRRGTLKVITDKERIAALQQRLQDLQSQLEHKRVNHCFSSLSYLPHPSLSLSFSNIAFPILMLTQW